MRAVIAVAFVACLVFVALTDGAAMKKKNKNKNKNECAAQEEALKMAGKWLCMMKREKLDMMIDHAESLSCFEDAKNMAMDQMRSTSVYTRSDYFYLLCSFYLRSISIRK